MNFEFAEQIIPDLENLHFEKALQTAETELKKIPATDFHDVLGKPLTVQANDLAIWVENFYQVASKKTKIKTLYFEMNGFDINTDLWYLDGFTYNKDGGLDLDDMDWLTDFETDSQTETGTIFIIEGYEKLQTAFETIKLKDDNLQNARDWCEHIIIARFMELMRTAHLVANKQKMKWATVPIYFTVHDYDIIIRSEN